MSRIYRKLGIRSRAELGRVVGKQSSTIVQEDVDQDVECDTDTDGP
jgi:hypothetical protein